MDNVGNLLKPMVCVAFLLVQCYASMGTSYGPVSVSLCLSQVSVLSKWMNRFINLFFGMEADQLYTVLNQVRPLNI